MKVRSEGLTHRSTKSGLESQDLTLGTPDLRDYFNVLLNFHERPSRTIDFHGSAARALRNVHV